jgi:cytochrome c-type biogenesis protein CcsB
VSINENYATYSKWFIDLALGAYVIAFFAYTLEWAFGTSSKLGARVASLGTAEQAGAAGAAIGRQAAAPVVESIGESGGVTVLLTRTAAMDEEPTIAGTSQRAEMIGRFAVMANIIAFAFHAAGVVMRGMAAHRAPWANMYEFSCAAALAMSFAYLVLLLTQKKVRWLGLPVTFVISITLGIAVTLLYTDAEQLVPALNSYWLYIHVTAAMLATGAYAVASVVSVLFLVKLACEEGRLGRFARYADRLPSSVALDRVAYRVVAINFPLWTFAIMAGAIWAEKAWGRYWGWDPKETWSFIVWVVYAAYLHARATHGWKGKAAAYVALIAFACVLFNYFGVNTLLTGKHSYAGL